MLYAKLKNEILAARDRRQRSLDQLTRGNSRTLLQLSLNIPGPGKTAAPFMRLFDWGEEQLMCRIEDLEAVTRQTDMLGPWALYTSSLTAAATKQIGCLIEEDCAAARLLDIDVYAANGTAYHRQQLGHPPRPCFICPAPAAECIRLNRHSSRDLQHYLDHLRDQLPT